MTRKSELTQESFDELLSWLSPNPAQAARKYEQIHQALTKILCRWGCSEAEELADETINRVAVKVRVIRQEYTGDPQRYFFGVVKKVFLEHQRKKQNLTELPDDLPIATPEATDELAYTCFESCLQKLSPEQQKLFALYYSQRTPDQRKRLARDLGTTLPALRVKMHRIVEELKRCVRKCVEQVK